MLSHLGSKHCELATLCHHPHSLLLSPAPSFSTRLQLQRDVGNEQALNALIQVYKNYYPDVIMGDTGPFKGNIFSVRFDLDGWGGVLTISVQHPSPEWLHTVLSIQEAEAASNLEKSAFKVVRQVGGQSSKRRKTERVVVPQVHTFGAVEVGFPFILSTPCKQH